MIIRQSANDVRLTALLSCDSDGEIFIRSCREEDEATVLSVCEKEGWKLMERSRIDGFTIFSFRR